MNIIFKKSNIPFLKNALREGNGRDSWTVARMMQDSDGMQHQLPAEIALLNRGAACGDAWSMCELARTYFNHCGDLFLPQALQLWKQAILQNDGGAKYDTEIFPIHDRILSYRSVDGNAYTAIEMQCAMLTEWHLTHLGGNPWECADTHERILRCEKLVEDACRVMQIPTVKTEFIPNLTFDNRVVDGLSHWDGKISVRKEILDDVERLIEVIFHELGHTVAFEILKGNNSAELKKIFGISDKRVLSWKHNEMGREVPASEEDPDTLSYGVYTLWATFFLPRHVKE